MYRISSINVYKATTVLSRSFSLSSTRYNVPVQIQAGVFKTISESTPVAFAQDFIVDFHNLTGLPWWATVITSTVLLRTSITVPLAIYQNYILAKVENLSLEMPPIVEEIKKEMALAVRKFSWTEPHAKRIFRKSVKKQWNALIVRDNCHPFKASVLIWVQIPMWVCISVSYRNLVFALPKQDADALLTLTELTLGGFSWIPNLTIPDSSLIIPVLLGLTNLAIIEIQTMSKLNAPSKFRGYLTNFFRFISIGMIPIAATVPSCVCLYWTTSSIYGLIQNLVLLSPRFKRLTGIPKTNSELSNPYLHLTQTFQNRFKTKNITT